MPWVAGSRDDVVEDDVFGEQVEEVPTIGNAIEALLDDAKERVERLEVVEVSDRRRHDGLPFMSIRNRSRLAHPVIAFLMFSSDWSPLNR